jgi:hypothetical protein
VRPLPQGGYGLSSYHKNQYGFGVILLAIAHGYKNLLSELVKPVSEGSYGQSLEYAKSNSEEGPVLVAVVQPKRNSSRIS